MVRATVAVNRNASYTCQAAVLYRFTPPRFSGRILLPRGETALYTIAFRHRGAILASRPL
jgi:hypothetical protein